ncbi:Gfo/Idh/MocA family protein [Rosistilla oblonga]|uniref:Inositol 2-dehydrogenase n=1 Tax=Rosistilla oblonga TaxID=2527990 RepID=A0A518IZZ6_9BACT|nr:Gfo/Idh/MocA family oxidoreductase [Rosistilla oblonga]QDV58660.1 Inositol 2-dehydrogenase [Rosistilla oblonga]
MPIDRRNFIASAAAAGALSAAPAIHGAQKNATYRTALIGSGWWGMNILREAVASQRVKVVAICDVDEDKRDLAAEEIEDLCGDQAKTYGDFREMLDREEIDIVIIATPDHWHALNAIAALEKGCHVFVEKPTGHTIGESRAMVDVAQATGRIVQVGLHRRSGPHHVAANQFLRDGNVGTIGAVRMFVNSRGGPERPSRNSEPPETLDWDMYCGPAPLRPFNRKIHPGGFRHFLDFANGTLGDWGVHWLDQMLMWSEEKSPKSVYSTGGRPVFGPAVLSESEQTTDAPDSQVAVYQFESFTATWEHRKFAGHGPERHNVGCYFYGDRGTLHIGWRDGWTFYPSDSKKAIQHQDAQLQEPDGHNMQLLWADFLQAIESGKQPACSALIGHQATNLSLLGMLSLKLGRSIAWDGETETIPGDEEANRLLRREYRGPWQYPS